MNARSVCQICAPIIGLMILVHTVGAATTYYVKNGGNDNDNGTSDGTAWATVNRVHIAFSAPTIGAGDSVLFKCGSKWDEQLVISQSGSVSGQSIDYITIGAYGSGARPIIGYDVVFSGWTATGDGYDDVYQITSTPEVWVVDETTTSGAASGYFRAYSRRTSIQAVEDQVGSSYWANSILYVHAYDDTDLTTALNKTLYGNTRGYRVQGISGDMGLGAIRTNDESYIKIQNIHAVNQGYGIGGMNTDHILIDDCRISGTSTATWFGHQYLETTTSNDITTQNCEVRFNGNGLHHFNASNLIVKDNTLGDSWHQVGGEDRTLVSAIGGFSNVQIYDNDFSEAKHGIEIDVRPGETGENIYIHHNRFHGDMFRGVVIWGAGTHAGDLHFYHNILWLPLVDIPDPMFPMNNPQTPRGLTLSAATDSSDEPFVVYNNTISARWGLYMVGPIELLMKNNIFYECFRHIHDDDDDDVANGVTHLRDYNCYYPVDTDHRIEWEGTPYTSWTLYHDHGGRDLEHDSFPDDPDFLNDSPDKDDVKITAGGTADNAGENAGAPFDVSTGLDFYGLGIGGQASVGASEGVSAP